MDETPVAAHVQRQRAQKRVEVDTFNAWVKEVDRAEQQFQRLLETRSKTMSRGPLELVLEQWTLLVDIIREIGQEYATSARGPAYRTFLASTMERRECFRILLDEFDRANGGLVDIDETAAAPFASFKALQKQAINELEAAESRFRLLM